MKKYLLPLVVTFPAYAFPSHDVVETMCAYTVEPIVEIVAELHSGGSVRSIQALDVLEPEAVPLIVEEIQDWHHITGRSVLQYPEYAYSLCIAETREALR